MKKLLLIGAIATTLTGCHSQLTFSTPSGLREYGRYRNGSLSVAKTPPGQEDYYHSTQKYAEEQKTLRIQLPTVAGGES